VIRCFITAVKQPGETSWRWAWSSSFVDSPNVVDQMFDIESSNITLSIPVVRVGLVTLEVIIEL
jgi:hypothetical protein